MREIKYKAWLKDEKSIVSVASLPLKANNGEYEVGLSVGFYYHDPTSCDDYSVDYTNIYNVELMQFTGRNDKNNKEIYEGYIVKTDEGEIGYILWIDCYCKFVIMFDNHCLYFEECDSQHLEIIGNIYENPELLKKRGCRK